MSGENVDLDKRLLEAGVVFIEAHDRAALVIREASDAGMSAQTIAQTSGLSLATVRIFLQTGAE
jgi:hypothetical protein